jgi:hypothetical protein
MDSSWALKVLRHGNSRRIGRSFKVRSGGLDEGESSDMKPEEKTRMILDH